MTHVAETVLPPAGPETVASGIAALKAGEPVVVLAPAGVPIPRLPAPWESERRIAETRRDAGAFLMRRQLVRALVQGAFDLAPETLAIDAGPQGAPKLASLPQLHISFAARDGHSLIGIATLPIGVDLEQRIPPETIPWNIMRPDEAAPVRAMPSLPQAEAFLAFWTRKEAVLKALGSGFSIPPEHLHLFDGQRFSVEVPGLGTTRSGALRLAETRWIDATGQVYGVATALLPPQAARVPMP